MKKVALTTLGCKVNQYDTEAMAGLFRKEGYEVVDFDETADVYVINTCTVTGISARKSRQMIRRAREKNKNSIVVVAGCYAQTAPEEVESIPGVNIVIGTRDRGRIVDYIREIEKGKERINLVSNIMKTTEFEEMRVDSFKEKTRAFIKIQEGCSQFCSYCIIPYARGPVRSRMPDAVLEEVRALAGEGFKEIVLTGIHIASYGKDLKDISLMDMIKRVHGIEGIERIRLSSIEPTIVNEDFVLEAKSLEKLCPHYHMSLQSGCDETLKRMRRKYTTSQYRAAVELLRRHIPDVALTTDIMVGFPGETDEEFEQTYRFVKEISFMKTHVFKYSPRKSTPAASMPDQVDGIVKEERSRRLLELSHEKNLEFNRKFIGRTLPVLFEQESNLVKGFMEGLTPNYIKVLCKGDTTLEGNIVPVKLKDTEGEAVIGDMQL